MSDQPSLLFLSFTRQSYSPAGAFLDAPLRAASIIVDSMAAAANCFKSEAQKPNHIAVHSPELLEFAGIGPRMTKWASNILSHNLGEKYEVEFVASHKGCRSGDKAIHFFSELLEIPLAWCVGSDEEFFEREYLAIAVFSVRPK